MSGIGKNVLSPVWRLWTIPSLHLFFKHAHLGPHPYSRSLCPRKQLLSLISETLGGECRKVTDTSLLRGRLGSRKRSRCGDFGLVVAISVEDSQASEKIGERPSPKHFLIENNELQERTRRININNFVR